MFVSDHSLPPFAFVEASDHDKANFRAGRNLLIHTSTLTLMEVFELANILIMDLPEDSPHLDFNFFNKAGGKVAYKIILQATIFEDSTEVLQQAAVWFSEYLKWYENHYPTQ